MPVAIPKPCRPHASRLGPQPSLSAAIAAARLPPCMNSRISSICTHPTQHPFTDHPTALNHGIDHDCTTFNSNYPPMHDRRAEKSSSKLQGCTFADECIHEHPIGGLLFCVADSGVVLIAAMKQYNVSQSVDYTSSSHLGLIRCLTLIVRVSNKHHMHAFTDELGYIQRSSCQKNCTMVGTPNNRGTLASSWMWPRYWTMCGWRSSRSMSASARNAACCSGLLSVSTFTATSFRRYRALYTWACHTFMGL